MTRQLIQLLKLACVLKDPPAWLKGAVTTNLLNRPGSTHSSRSHTEESKEKKGSGRVVTNKLFISQTTNFTDATNMQHHPSISRTNESSVETTRRTRPTSVDRKTVKRVRASASVLPVQSHEGTSISSDPPTTKFKLGD